MLIEALEVRQQNFFRQLSRVRRRISEPGVHDLRVATRRLIAVMDLMSEITEIPLLQKKRRVLRRLLKGLNALRDAHICSLALGRLRAAFPSAGMVQRSIRVQERDLLRSVGRNLRLFDVRGLRGAITEAENLFLAIGINSALASAHRAVLMGALASAYARVVRRLQSLQNTDPSTVHRLRVAFKQYRYSLEILAPLLRWMNARTRSRLDAYQTAMGKIQDIVVVLRGMVAYESRRPVTGRMALIEVRQYLLRRTEELMKEFRANADDAYRFWKF
jgi:CHAD domain-containing protein